MKSKFKKLMAAALVLCLMLALLPAGVLADGVTFKYKNYDNGDFGTNGSGYTYGSISVTENSNGYTLTADPDSGYGLKQIKIGDGEELSIDVAPGETYSHDFNVEEGVTEVTITAAFKPVYTITVDPNMTGGTVEVSSKTAFEKDVITLTAKPNAGFALDGVITAKKANSEDSVAVTDNKITIGNYNVVVSASFKEIPTHSIDVDTNITGGSVATSPASSAYEEQLVTLSNTPEKGYEFVSYSVTAKDGTPVSVSGNTFTMPNDDVTVSATFKKVETPPPVVVPDTYNVNVSSTTGGSAWADKSTGLEAGTWVTVYVQPSDGYYLKSLTVDGYDVTSQITWDWYWNWYYSRTGTYSFQMPANNVNVVATFDTWYDGDIACIYDGRFGNVTLNVWSQALDRFVPYTSASKGDLVQVIVEPYNGYAMNSLSISERNYWGSSVDYWQSWKHDNVYYFYMPDSDVNLYVDFTEAVSEHIVYVDRAANGSLKADTTWAADGQIVYVTATPDTGYVLSSLFVKTAKGDQLKVYEAKKTGTYYFYMPDQYVTVSAYFAPAASALPFNDVAYTSWYYDAVKFVYDKGIMDGVSYYRFAPDATITRGMVVTMLWRMAGEPYEAAAGFTDVAAGRYYTTAVAWAARNGIVEGMTSTTFAPDQAITREQLASILYRYAKWLGFSGYGSDISGYTDAGKVSSYAYDAMSWAVRSGVVTGTSAKVLDPQGTASRAAAAQMFMNFYNYIK